MTAVRAGVGLQLIRVPASTLYVRGLEHMMVDLKKH